MIRYKYAGLTRQGIRNENQDDFIIFDTKNKYIVAAVADGMGGHLDGKLASKMTIELVKKIFYNIDFNNLSDVEIQNLLITYMKDIQSFLNEEVEKRDLSFDMGTTLNLNIFYGNKLFTINIGDSRATLWEKNHHFQISEDHNLAQLAKKNDAFKKYSNFTNYLTSALGPRRDSKVDIYVTLLDKKGYIIITSDGVHNYLKDEEYNKILKKKTTIEEKTKKIIETAEKNKSVDNMTCILVNYELK
ncbi:MAG: protein phosphatase [Candidatus Hepatoplasma vulgare]|nr:MAG: protein phosphatase [Candidatus Hepatoplasma sp.]